MTTEASVGKEVGIGGPSGVARSSTVTVGRTCTDAFMGLSGSLVAVPVSPAWADCRGLHVPRAGGACGLLLFSPVSLGRVFARTSLEKQNCFESKQFDGERMLGRVTGQWQAGHQVSVWRLYKVRARCQHSSADTALTLSSRENSRHVGTGGQLRDGGWGLTAQRMFHSAPRPPDWDF